jgi:hypothetical protein
VNNAWTPAAARVWFRELMGDRLLDALLERWMGRVPDHAKKVKSPLAVAYGTTAWLLGAGRANFLLQAQSRKSLELHVRRESLAAQNYQL